VAGSEGLYNFTGVIGGTYSTMGIASSRAFDCFLCLRRTKTRANPMTIATKPRLPNMAPMITDLRGFLEPTAAVPPVLELTGELVVDIAPGVVVDVGFMVKSDDFPAIAIALLGMKSLSTVTSRNAHAGMLVPLGIPNGKLPTMVSGCLQFFIHAVHVSVVDP